VSDSLKTAFYDNVLIVKNTIISINISKLLSYTIYARKNIARTIAISTSSTNIKNTTHVKIVNTSRELRTAKKNKKKIDLTRRIKMKLYFVEKSQTIREVFKFVVAKFIESKTLFHE
jgi:hypothetical protein